MTIRKRWLESQGMKATKQESWKHEWHYIKYQGEMAKAPPCPEREDPENADAAAKLAFMQGRGGPVGRGGRQAKATCRFGRDGQVDAEIFGRQ